jgi:prevent-host-death family protein
MTAHLGDLRPPKLLPSVSTDQLRNSISQTINRAAFGTEPVLVTRRGRKIAAIISIGDLTFLETMKRRKDEVMSEDVPPGLKEIGPALARRLRWDLFFG